MRSDHEFVEVTILLRARLNIQQFYSPPTDAIHKLLEIIKDGSLRSTYIGNRHGFAFEHEAAAKIKAIAGPHHHTWLKAYEANRK